MSAVNDLVKGFLESEHPIYEQRKEQWAQDEKLYRGGKEAREMLMPFYWEAFNTENNVGPEHFAARKKRARYINHGQRTAMRLVGHLTPEAPRPGSGINMGSLGEVRDISEVTEIKSLAERIWYNVDGRGSSFLSFMDATTRRAMSTGHRWIGVESPPEATTNDAEIFAGKGPYLTALSPLQVPNWIPAASGGGYEALAIKMMRRELFKDGKFTGTMVPEYVLYVKAGFEGFGEDYTGGGWWRVNEKFEYITGEDGNPIMGNLKSTNGEIPYRAYILEEDDERMSVSLLEDINVLALTQMDLASAGFNDAIEGGGRMLAVLGADENSMNTAADVKRKGGRMIPFEVAVAGNNEVVKPEIWDSAEHSASGALKEQMEQLEKDAELVTEATLNAAPDASGKSRQFQFRDVKQPRLAMIASSRESIERWILNTFALRLGKTPDVTVEWVKDFDLSDKSEDWKAIIEAMTDAGVDSPKLIGISIRKYAEARGAVIQDSDWSVIESEIKASLERRDQEDSLIDPSGSLGGDDE